MATREIDEMRREIAELREAVLTLAFCENQRRLHEFNLPKGKDIRSDKLVFNVARIVGELGSIPSNVPNIQGSDWLTALEHRGGASFADIRAAVEEREAKRER